MPSPAAPVKLDLHVVIHVRNLRTTAGVEAHESIVAGPTDWSDAQAIWTKLDDRRRQRASQTTRKVDSYYKVRSIHDPEVAPLLEQCSYHKSNVLAARAWGKRNGLLGNRGGWIYGLPGDPHQGWDAVAHILEASGDIASGQHPVTGRFCWISHGAPTVRSFARVG